MDYAQGEEARPDRLATRVLFLNFVSIHTTATVFSIYMPAKTSNFTHAIYNLAAYPEYVEPLHEEIQSVMLEEKIWTKKRVMKMRKLDSFIKESMRMHPFIQCTGFVKVVLTWQKLALLEKL